MGEPDATSGRARIVVVGLGPAGPELLTVAARSAIERIPVRFVRTTRDPSAVAVPDARSFDHHYEQAERFEQVYDRIAGDLISAAREHGEVLYAVPGSPRVLERSVDQLLAAERVDVELVPSLSFLELAWARLGIDPVEAGVALVDGHRFAVEAASRPGPLLVAHVHDRRVCSDIKLSVEAPSDTPVIVLQRLGSQDEAVFETSWAELDRSFEPDHLTALYVPALAAPVASELQRFAELVDTLRQQCPWDRSQTHASLGRHLVEEAYETLDALDGLERIGVRGAVDGRGLPIDDDVDPDAKAQAYAHLEEELGDLLFQVGLHARLAAEQGAFTLADVARGIHDKLVARHPHVFAGEAVIDLDGGLGDFNAVWETSKREEKGRASVMDGIAPALPALLYATKVLGKATSVPGGQELVDALPPVERATGDLAGGAVDVDTVGAALLAVVVHAQRQGLDAEAALRGAARRVADAVRALEARHR